MIASTELAEFLGRIAAGRDGVPISIDEAQEVSGLRRASVLERFRQLQAQGEGYLRLGRHGHPTRFYFRSAAPGRDGQGARPPAAAAIVAAKTPPAARDSDAVAPAELVEHLYQLRPDLRLTIRLPGDLSDREAGRLARFIETLPL